MHRSVRIILAAAVAVCTACAHAPRVGEETQALLRYRSEYLRNNPNGPFNEHIERGEVVRGMGYLEVLAAWGMPAARRPGPRPGTEAWVFYGRDDASQDWMEYEFVFEKGAVVDWDVWRHYAKNGAIPERERLVPRPDPPSSAAFAGGVPVKR